MTLDWAAIAAWVVFTIMLALVTYSRGERHGFKTADREWRRYIEGFSDGWEVQRNSYRIGSGRVELDTSDDGDRIISELDEPDVLNIQAEGE